MNPRKEKTQMKVLHLMNGLHPSGMERMFVSAGAYFAENGVDSVIVGQGDDHPFKEQLKDANYRVRTIAHLKRLAGMRAFVRLLLEEQPQVVHIHSEGSYAVAAILARAAIRRVVLIRTIHNVFQPSGLAAVKRRLQRLAADWLIGEFISVSPDVQRNERRFGRSSTLIYNWVDDRFFELRKVRLTRTVEDESSVVIVGNSSPVKNQLLALEAIRSLPVKLYFHGDERGANPQEVLILDALQKERRLLYRGTGDPAPSLLASSLYAMPSKHEGMSIALAEALVVGVPAFINDAPGQSWAAKFPGVTVLEDDLDLWIRHLGPFLSGSTRVEESVDLPIDLSAERGAREYSATYERLCANNATKQ